MGDSVDNKGDHPRGAMPGDGVLEDGLAGARLAKDQAEPALLCVDLEDVEVALLVLHERRVLVDGEWIPAEAEEGLDHSGWMLGTAVWRLTVK